MHGLDEDVDEPPSSVKDDWRKQAAAALVCMTSSAEVSSLIIYIV